MQKSAFSLLDVSKSSSHPVCVSCGLAPGERIDERGCDFSVIKPPFGV